MAVKAAVPKGLESFYGQRVEWYDCGATGGMEKSAEATAFKCAKVKVPLDYSQPDGQTIEIAMKKHVATGSIHRGSLFINPGGPGGSGVQYVEAAAETSFAGVQGSYDIIGFDPPRRRILDPHYLRRCERRGCDSGCRGWGATGRHSSVAGGWRSE